MCLCSISVIVQRKAVRAKLGRMCVVDTDVQFESNILIRPSLLKLFLDDEFIQQCLHLIL